MATFQLKSGPDTLDFDLQGNVTRAGAAFGQWTVTKGNKIEVTPTGRPPSDIAVDWGFNGDNELELRQSGNVIFNFHDDPNVQPDFLINQGVLVVFPDQDNQAFTFGIRGTWGLDPNFNLLLTVGTVKSSINGILKDTQASEFGYIFDSLGPAPEQHELDFSGAWTQNGSGVDVSFAYDTEDPAHPGVIILPAGLNIDPTKNILVYTYNKATHSGRLELAGELRVNQDFSITYILDEQTSAGITSTTFQISTQFKTDTVGQGNLQVTVKRRGEDLDVQVGGQYQGVVAGLALTVGFTYDHSVQGNVVTDTVGFTGSVTNPRNGDKFSWIFDLGPDHFELDISAHIVLEPHLCANAAFNFNVKGNDVTITAMFGISTNC